jgi:hypothetical protein
MRHTVTMPPLRSPWLCIPNSAFENLIVPCCPRTYPYISALRRLLLSHSRWAGYLQSLPNGQNWHGIALFWGAALPDPLSSRDASDDGRRVESGGLDPDSDAVEARRWLRCTEAETHLLLPDPPRTPLLVCPFAGSAVTSSSKVEDDSHTKFLLPLQRVPECYFGLLLFHSGTPSRACGLTDNRERISTCLCARQFSCIHG